MYLWLNGLFGSPSTPAKKRGVAVSDGSSDVYVPFVIVTAE